MTDTPPKASSANLRLRKSLARDLLKRIPYFVREVHGAVPEYLANTAPDDPLRIEYQKSSRNALLTHELLTEAEMDTLPIEEATRLAEERFRANMKESGLDLR